jgi:hypothetical protein
MRYMTALTDVQAAHCYSLGGPGDTAGNLERVGVDRRRLVANLNGLATETSALCYRLATDLPRDARKHTRLVRGSSAPPA